MKVVGADIGTGNIERGDPLRFRVNHTGPVLQRSFDAQNRAVMDHGTIPKIHLGIKDSLTSAEYHDPKNSAVVDHFSEPIAFSNMRPKTSRSTRDLDRASAAY